MRLAFTAVTALAWMAARACAAPLDVVEIAPGIFVHHGAHEEASKANEGSIANIGFIVGDTSVMIVDTGGSAAIGGRLREAVRAVTPLPIRYVVLTHVHPDHVLGAAAFEDDAPEFIGHAKLPGALARRGAFYLRALGRSLGELAVGTTVVAPTRVIARSEVIDLGNRRVVLTPHGTAHTDNDLSLFDQKTHTLWLGDLLFIDRLPAIDGSLVGWLRELQALASVAALRVVPGHGPPSVAWPVAIEAEMRYLEAVLDDTRTAIGQGIDIADAASRVAVVERDRWLLFDDYHGRNVVTAYRELEWE